MHVGIDGDVLRYELGAVSQAKEVVFGKEFLVPWATPQVHDLVDSRIETIVKRTGASDFTVFLSHGSNFRFDIATLDPYKGNRTSGKPYHWQTVSDHLLNAYDAIMVAGAEADDALSLAGRADPEEYVIASRDKDLRIVPCYHYSWRCGEQQPEIPVYKVEELGDIQFTQRPSGGFALKGNGLKFFYGQILCGDSIDNYKGCRGVGPKKAAQLLTTCKNETELFQRSVMEYYRTYGREDGCKRFFENARLAWLLDDAEVQEEIIDDRRILHVSPRNLWQPPQAFPTLS